MKHAARQIRRRKLTFTVCMCSIFYIPNLKIASLLAQRHHGGWKPLEALKIGVCNILSVIFKLEPTQLSLGSYDKPIDNAWSLNNV